MRPPYTRWRALLCLLLLSWGAAPLYAAPEGQAAGDTVVITVRDIRRLNLRSVQELLNHIPGVRAGENSVSIRGSRAVRVLLDGMPLNDRSAHGVKLEMVPFRQLEKVIVIKGGGGTFYGDYSGGGVIRFITRRAGRTRTFLELYAGSLELRGLRAGISRQAGAWGLAAGAHYRREQGYRSNNDKEVQRVNLKLSYQPPNRRSGRGPSLSLDYGERRYGSPGYPRHPTPRARAHNQSLGACLRWQGRGLASGTFFTRFRNRRTDPDRGIDSVLTTWTLRQDFTRRLELPWLGKLHAGLGLQNEHGQGTGLEPRDEQTYALFALKHLHRGRLGLRLGLRVNLYSAFGTALNPEARLSWRLGPAQVWAAVSHSNQTPTFRQRYFRHSTLRPNPALGMERSTNYGLGLCWSGPAWLKGEVSLFYNQTQDRITFVRGDDGVGQYRNAGRTCLQGLDASVALRPFPWLEVKPSYTYLEAKDQDTGLWLAGKPRHKLKLEVVLRPRPGSMLGLHYTYVGRVFTRADNREQGPAYHLVALRGEYTWGEGWRLFARVDNLLDQDYLYADGMPAPPRTWQVGLGREF